MKQLSLLLLSAALLFSITTDLAFANTKLPANIDHQQLLTLQESEQPYLLLDVRSDEEYQQGHIPGATNIDYRQLSDNLSTLNEFKDHNIVVYCRSGRRAGIAIETLKELGFSNVSHLEGDMQLWRKKQMPEQK